MVDYSKWKDIEISDDEDETHPNIDTPSLFRWRHQARVERMEQQENEKKSFETKKKSHQLKCKEIQEKIKKGEGNVEELQKELSKLEFEGKKIDVEEEDFKKKEKKTPWNVDTISKPGFEKTVINKLPQQKNNSELTDEEREKKMRDFIKQHEKLMKQYGMMKKYDDSKKFLLEHNQLVSEDTANYLVIWCINLEIEEKHELMTHVAHQCICIQYVLELAKQLDIDPRACVGSFFDKIQNAVVEYRQQFDNEIAEFIERIERRAKEKIDEAIKQQEEEDRKARLGPGGLDPNEVFETLPEALQQCFTSRDTQLLQETIAKMPEEEAKYHMKRCVDSGMWVPDARAKKILDGEIDEDEGDEVYQEVNESSENTEDMKNTASGEEKPISKGVSSDDID